ncbi:hypothetical protein ACFOWU_09975 [Epilithonimonas zeae]|uniref:Uncharacterized protein n=1 Tax=Epilithonimonas zeae TaxID=1416779 RepID=A0A1N6GVY1_9FLAO|nr:hypothetical protein [Epilithonimonas zeae]SIO11525.1 hypothetical protein SAMN05444409_2079 [Epilithonimonas zeae]
MIHQDDFKNYRHQLFLFDAIKIERTCAVYIFLFFLIYFPGQSQIYQRENNGIYITKGTKIISENHLHDSGCSDNIYVLDGTTITGLRENTKSKIHFADLRYKHLEKSLKQVISKKGKKVANSKAEGVNLKIVFKTSSNSDKFTLLTNHFLTPVAPSNPNCDKLSSVLQINTVQFAIDFGGKTAANQNSTLTLIRSISNFHSIRPPPYVLPVLHQQIHLL